MGNTHIEPTHFKKELPYYKVYYAKTLTRHTKGDSKKYNEMNLFSFFQMKNNFFLLIKQRLPTTNSFQEELEDPICEIGKEHEGEASEKTKRSTKLG